MLEREKHVGSPAVEFLYYMRSGRLLRIFFLNLDFSRGFLYTSLISPEGTAKLRWAGRRTLYILGCSVAQF